jgi:hypothetical protein
MSQCVCARHQPSTTTDRVNKDRAVKDEEGQGSPPRGDPPRPEIGPSNGLAYRATQIDTPGVQKGRNLLDWKSSGLLNASKAHGSCSSSSSVEHPRRSLAREALRQSTHY